MDKIIKNLNLKSYQRKYRHNKAHILSYTKHEVEMFDKFNKPYVKNYVLKGRKWALIGDTYYEIPKAPRWTWFRNANPAIKVCAYALVLGALGGGGYGVYAYINRPVPYKDIINKVNAMNEALAEHKDKFIYPKLAVDYLKSEKNIPIDTLTTGNEDIEYGYNLANNEIVLVGTKDDNLKYSKTKTNKTSDVWRFKDTYTLSAKSNDETYGTYLRKNDELKFDVATVNKNLLTNYSEEEDKIIKFNSNIDVGENTKYKLVFEKPVDTTAIPMVVTNHNDLEVDGCLGDISHYGHATSITVAKLDGTYYEYGTVDGDIIINGENKVNVEIKEEAKVNTIVVNNKNEETKIKINDDSEVGSVVATEESGLKPTEIVEASEKKKEEIEIKDDPIDPEELKDFSGGLGTEKSPFTIDLKDQLKKLSTKITEEGFDTKWYKVTANIDLNNDDFTPIGSGSVPFAGHFDGGNNTISNLKVSQTKYAGLFGCIKGTNNSFATEEDLWDFDNEIIKPETISVDKYDAVVQNINLSNVDVKATDKFCGGIAGDLRNATIRNCNVLSGNIYGFKCVGGITGNTSNGTTVGCKTGKDLLVEASDYNAAGISGTLNYSEDIQGAAIVDCVNNANVKTYNKVSKNGNTSGIVSMVQSGDANLVIGCTNNGYITTTCSEGQDVGSAVAGICSNAINLKVTANCTNNGYIEIPEGVRGQDASGIISYGNYYIYNCVNKGDVKAYVDDFGTSIGTISGVYGYNKGDTIIATIINSYNYGTITSLNPNKEANEVVSNFHSLIVKDVTYANVSDLNKIHINGNTLEFKNVTCNNKDEAFIINPSISTFKSDNNKFANNIRFVKTNNNQRVYIYVNDFNLIIDEDFSNIDLNLVGNNSTLTITQNGKLSAASVNGNSARLINNGTVFGTIALYGDANYMENNGRCSAFCFGGNASSEQGHGDKLGINNGTISKTKTGINQHVVNCIAGDCDITFKNYGTVEFIDDESVSGATGYLYCIHTSGSITLYQYEDSINKQTVASYYISNSHDCDVHYNSNAKFMLNDTNLGWTIFSGNPYIHLHNDI